MIGLLIALAILGFFVGCIAGFGIIFGLVEGHRAVATVSTLLVVAGFGAVVFGIVQSANLERQQCEEAGFEWITGTCYGTNVNINEGHK